MEVVKVSKGFSNVYLVLTKDKKALIDTGVPEDRQVIMDRMAARGVSADSLDYIFLTHGHVDHIGNAAFFQKVFGVKVIMAEADLPLIKNPQNSQFNYTKGIVGRCIKGFSKGKKTYDDFIPDVLISKGKLSSYWMGEEVHFIPGHTKGSIGILFNDGSFFSGDTFFNLTHPCISLLGEDEESLKASLRYLKTLPIKVIYPGHGGLIHPKKSHIRGYNR